MLDSIKSQTYDKFEVILADDGSTDSSSKICQDICEKDSRFHLYVPDYKLGNTVRFLEWSLDKCNGEYWFYLSQDDFFDSDLFEQCVKTSIEKNADIVIPNGWNYFGKNNKKRIGSYPVNNDYNSILTGYDAFIASLPWEIHGFSLRKTELVKKVGIKSKWWPQCEYYTRLHFLNADKVAFCNSNFYYRQNNPDAITHKFQYFFVDSLCVNYMLIKKCIEIGVDKSIINRRYIGHLKQYLVWYFTMISKRVVFTKHCYVPRILLGQFPKLLVMGYRVIALNIRRRNEI